jgi:hypothetical protein
MNEQSRPALISVPPIDVPPFDPPVGEESRQFIDELLDFKIKRAGTYGGLTVACALYLVGVLVILKWMAIWPFNCAPLSEVTSTISRVVECVSPRLGDDSLHGFAGVMLALFSVPTVLLIAILRAASPKREPLPDTVFTTVADKFANAMERVFEPRK